MILYVTDETYKYFSHHFPHVSKDELEGLLKKCTPFKPHEYETPEVISESGNRLIGHQDFKLFHVPDYISNVFDLPSVISLKANSEGVIYWYTE